MDVSACHLLYIAKCHRVERGREEVEDLEADVGGERESKLSEGFKVVEKLLEGTVKHACESTR